MRVGVAAGGTRAHCHLQSCRISHSPIAVLVCVRGIHAWPYTLLPHLRVLDHNSLSSQRLFQNVFRIIDRRFKPCNLVSRTHFCLFCLNRLNSFLIRFLKHFFLEKDWLKFTYIFFFFLFLCKKYWYYFIFYIFAVYIYNFNILIIPIIY